MATTDTNMYYANDTNSLSLSAAKRRLPMKRRIGRSASSQLSRMTSRSYLYLFLVLVASCLLGSTTAYRVGDAIDTDIRLASGTSDALRVQMPQFGVSSKANFRFEDQDSFSLQFEDGLRGLPWVSLVKGYKGQALEKLVVTFVYSKSGGGAIHTVLSEPVYRETAARPQQAGSFQVEYNWVEEVRTYLIVTAKAGWVSVLSSRIRTVTSVSCYIILA
jgi:hypothetical protein